MDRQVGRYQKVERQMIGDRVVLNPRTRLCSLRDAEGNVFDTFRLSLEVCGCGYSFARAGVGTGVGEPFVCEPVLLRAGGGGLQRLGRLVLQAMRATAHIGRGAICERPGPPEARFIAGERVRREHPGISRLVHTQRSGGRHGSTTERRCQCMSTNWFQRSRDSGSRRADSSGGTRG